MKKLLLIILTGLIISKSNSQKAEYYANGYLLYGKDTTWCKIWFNPSSPFFKASISTWQKDTTVEISLVKNNTLTGFGIIDEDYNLHWGRIIVDGKSGKINMYVLKIVAGTLELYEHHYVKVSTLRGTMNTTRQDYFNYYLGRTDANPILEPALLKSLKKKFVLPFISDNKKLCEELKEKLTPEELVAIVIRYNKEKYAATH
jgi:hypothetical protein